MAFSRRAFFGVTAASAAGVAAAWRKASSSALGAELSAEIPRASREFVLLDCGAACAIRESLAGYESAFKICDIPYRRVSFPPPSAVNKLIVPAAHLTDRFQFRQLKESLERGATLFFESGAAFLEAHAFELHCRLVELEFGIWPGKPRRLWQPAQSLPQVPYISYRWPMAAEVRDFSFIIPVEGEDCESIARLGELSVAVKRPFGRGMLVFLGSPLGPHLLSGDREAHQWFKQFCSSC